MRIIVEIYSINLYEILKNIFYMEIDYIKNIMI